MRHLIRILLVLLASLPLRAQQTDSPQLDYVCELRVTCDAPYSCGKTQKGERIVIPITGGTFEGPRLQGTVLPGGADYQLVDHTLGRTELEAIYCIRTHDGCNIHVRNRGLLTSGAQTYYFMTSPIFEAPMDSPYAWLNNAIFVCRPEVKETYISLKVWMVR